MGNKASMWQSLRSKKANDYGVPQPQHLQLALAERLDQRRREASLGRVVSATEARIHFGELMRQVVGYTFVIQGEQGYVSGVINL